MNQREEEIWIKKLRDKLDNHVEPLPADGWTKLSKELEPPVATRHIYPYKWWAVAAAIAVLVLGGISALYMLENTSIDKIQYTEIPLNPALPDKDPVSKDSNPVFIEPIQEQNIHKVSRNRETLAVVSKQTIAENIPAEKNINKAITDETVNDITVTETIQESNEQKEPVITRPSGKDKFHLPVTKKKKRNPGWSTGVSMSNILANNSQPQKGNPVPNHSKQLDMLSSNASIIEIRPDEQLVFKDGVPYIESNNRVEIDHKQPISFGLSVRKQLTENFSIETGLVYTQLKSTIKEPGNTQEIQQKLHYLGIPVRGNYNFMNSKRFTVYGSVGGMVEKCIDGKIGEVKEKEKPLQWSLNGGVGAQFNAHKSIGIYVEPGIAYFFDNGSDLETIRKDRPFNLNIQAGIRFTY